MNDLAQHSAARLMGMLKAKGIEMRAASVEKEVRELQLMADSLDNGFAKHASIVRRAIRMLQEQQAQLALSQKQPIDLRLAKVEENARLAKVGRSYIKARKAMNTHDGSVLDGFHGFVDQIIAKD